MASLRSLQSQSQPSAKVLLTSLISTVEGWDTLVKSLTSEDIAFSTIISWIQDILRDEESFAMFVQGLLQYPSVSKLLKDVPEKGQVMPLFTRCPQRVSLADRKAFLRALVGLANVLPIFCWANSEGRHHALQRVIHAFLIWQQEPGYADVSLIFTYETLKLTAKRVDHQSSPVAQTMYLASLYDRQRLYTGYFPRRRASPL